MTENIACMKSIIEFVADNVNVIIKDDGFYLGETDLSKIIEGTSQEIEYQLETLISNFLICCKNGYIISNVNTLDLSQKTLFTDCKVTDVTPSGLKFIGRSAR